MLQTEIIPGTTIVSATLEGGFTAQDIHECQKHVHKVNDEGSKAHLLMTFHNFEISKVSPQAAWADLKASELLNDVDRFAVAADKEWLEKFSEMLGFLSPAKVKAFGLGERAEALAWLRGGDRA